MTPDARRRAIVWASAIAGLAAATLGMLVLRGHLEETHVALVFLLVVLAGSAAGGRALGLVLSGLAFFAFDYLFLPPYGTLVIANPLDWLALVTFLITAIVAAQLLTSAQERAAEARRRTVEVQRLAELGAETLNAGRTEDALTAIADVIRGTLGVDRCDIFARADGGALRIIASAPDRPRANGDAAASAGSLLEWVAEHGAPASEAMDGTARVGSAPAHAQEPWSEALAAPGARVLVLPLRVRDRTVGVLRVEDRREIALAREQREFLAALGFYAALGVERLRLTADAEHVAALREADRLKNALLAAVSHDLRTPLTTIKALAHAIGENGARAGDGRAASIEEESDRLTRVVGDLLELSRLAGGALVLKPELNTAEDLIGAAMQRVAGIARGQEVRVVRPADAPLLTGRFDFVHALRALGNLVENALKYGGGSPVEIGAHRYGGMLVFTVGDRGPGVPERERERIFEPFYRPPNVPPDIGGTGLGLTIARGLAAAQGGDVVYRPRPGGGSLFEMRLPAEDARVV